MEDIELGELQALLQFMSDLAAGLEVESFRQLFDQVKVVLRQQGQWTAEVEAGFAEAEAQLSANPELFDLGVKEFQAGIAELLKKYPPETPISQIPELTDGGGTGNPPIEPGPNGIHIVDIAAAFADVTVDYDAGTGVVTVNGAGFSWTLPDIDRLTFDNGTLALDVGRDGIAGQAFRIYQAAFDRVPDGAGLTFWIKTMDGGQTLQDVARGFVNSVEFKAIYGEDPTALELVSKFYLNVLGREGEAEGIKYWVGQVEAGKSVEDTLMGFSQSQENITGTAPAVSDGIFYV